MRPRLKAAATRSVPMWRMYDSPRASASFFLGSTSKPITGKPRSSNSERERQPDVPEPDHPDPRLLARDLRRELLVLVTHIVWRC